MNNQEKINISDEELQKIAGAGGQEEEKKEVPKRTLYAGDCFELKDEASNTSIRVKIIHDYIDLPLETTVVQAEMKRIYNPTGLVISDYPDWQMPMNYYFIEEKNYVGSYVW